MDCVLLYLHTKRFKPSHYLEKQCEEIRCTSCGPKLENICDECDEYHIKISDLKHHTKIRHTVKYKSDLERHMNIQYTHMGKPTI